MMIETRLSVWVLTLTISSTVAQAQSPHTRPLEKCGEDSAFARVSARFVDPQSRPLENVFLWCPKQSVPPKKAGQSRVVVLKSGQFRPKCVLLTLADVLVLETQDPVRGHSPITTFLETPPE